MTYHKPITKATDRMRHPVSNKPILNDVVCVDDFGDMGMTCWEARV